MKFSAYPYTRPDFAHYQATFDAAVKKLTAATSAQSASLAIEQLNQLRQTLFTQSKLAYIRHSLDTNDPFYEQEDDYWNQYQPRFDELHNRFYRALVTSPFKTELEKIFPPTLFLFSEDQLKLVQPETIPLKQQENEWISRYTRLIASAQIDFRGQTYTLAEVAAFFTDPDRSVRKAAQAAYEHFFTSHETEFDEIYDQLVKLRTAIARQAGFKDYVAYADVAMNRWGYTRQQVQAFRKFILTEVVPVTQKLYQQQAKRLELEELEYYDLPLQFKTGNPKPVADQAELIQLAQTMYQELSPETGSFFQQLVQAELLDLTSRPGKQSGGYCEYLDGFKAPFIFANFNGTADDIDVLTHEAGHAFQTSQSTWITEPELVFPTSEAAEIHSMSMEFLTYPYLDRFFAEPDKYRFAHLSSALTFLPYGALVDHFQEAVYQHPDWSASQRKKCWRELEQRYCPEKNYRTSPALTRGTFWYRQGHIFEVPFYYIDYTLAQVCAFQFLLRHVIEQDPSAWSDYLTLCQLGGSQPFLTLLAKSQLASPFDLAKMSPLIKKISDQLDQWEKAVH